MADAELLLTIDGTDVTADVWQWSTVTYSDAWDQHPALGFTLRQSYGSVSTLAAYDDVRLVNLLTGVVLFEGIIQPGELVQTERDPGYVESHVRCVGYQALFDTSRVQVEVAWSDPASVATAPQAEDMIREVLAVSFADARVPLTVTTYPGDTPWAGGFVLDRALTITQRTTLSAALVSILDACKRADDGLTAMVIERAAAAKLLPGLGVVIPASEAAPRGTAPVTLTAASFGRPAVPVKATDATDASAYVWVTDGSAYTVFAAATAGYSGLTNGYAVWGPDCDASAADWAPYYQVAAGAPVASYRLVSPLMPYDVLVGHELTFNTPWLDAVTGVVQSVQTSFSDGVYDTTAASWPNFLDGTLTINGTWTLDATSSRSIPRRMRRTTITLAASNAAPATPRRTVRRLRKGTF